MLLQLLVVAVVILAVLMGCGGDSDDESPSLDASTAPFLGAGMFALDNPKFDKEKALGILRASISPVVSYIPNVFGKNKTNYPYMLDTLISENIGTHVQLYVLCGPCRIPRRDGSMVQFKPDLDIPGFQKAIKENSSVRSQYVAYVKDVIVPLIEAYPELNFTVVPELEDNQTNDSFAALLQLTTKALGDRSNVVYQRNPLYHNGQRTFNGQTVALEMHTTSINDLNLLRSGDAISFDGQLFSFRGESLGCTPNATFEQTTALIRASMSKGVSVHVWRPSWQGLPNCGGPVLDPSLRTYEFTYIDQIKELLSLK